MSMMLATGKQIQRWAKQWSLGCENFLPGPAWLLLNKTGPLFGPSLYKYVDLAPNAKLCLCLQRYTLEKTHGHCVLYKDCERHDDTCNSCATGPKFCSVGLLGMNSTSSSPTTSNAGLGAGIFIAVLMMVIVGVGLALKFRKERRNSMDKSARLTDLEQVDFEE